MLKIRDSLIEVFVLVLDIITKAWKSEKEVGFDFVLERWVKGIPNWSKTSDNSHVKDGGSYHSTTKVKGVSWALPKEKL